MPLIGQWQLISYGRLVTLYMQTPIPINHEPELYLVQLTAQATVP